MTHPSPEQIRADTDAALRQADGIRAGFPADLLTVDAVISHGWRLMRVSLARGRLRDAAAVAVGLARWALLRGAYKLANRALGVKRGEN